MGTKIQSLRLTYAVADQLAREAERERTTVADIMRVAIAQYFDRRQHEAALLGLEHRLASRLDAHTHHISSGLAKILAMAEPA